MQYFIMAALSKPANSEETLATKASLNTGRSLGVLKRFQEPRCFEKARFNLKLYKQGSASRRTF